MGDMTVTKGLGIILGIALIFFLGTILGTLVGYVIGWVISISPLAWHVEQGFAVFGLDAQGAIPQIGAMLGFVGGFFKAVKYGDN